MALRPPVLGQAGYCPHSKPGQRDREPRAPTHLTPPSCPEGSGFTRWGGVPGGARTWHVERRDPQDGQPFRAAMLPGGQSWMRSASSVPTPCFLSALRDLGETLGMLAPAETRDSLAPRYAP